MKSLIHFLIFITFATSYSCSQNQVIVESTDQKQKTIISNQEQKNYDIYQLDNFPDMIIKNKDYEESTYLTSRAAFNILFTDDSCQFLGWMIYPWIKLIKISENKFQIAGADYFLEFTSESHDKLIEKRGSNTNININSKDAEIFHYHRVDSALSYNYLKKLIVIEIFAARYQLLFKDTLECENEIRFDENYGISGIQNVIKFDTDPFVDLDCNIPNSFGFFDIKNKLVRTMSFKFSGDTLFLKDIKYTYSKEREFTGVVPTKTRIKLLKIGSK